MSQSPLSSAQALQAEGRMRPAGLAAYAHRRADRSVVYAYEQAEAATLAPAELAEFQQQAAAYAYFEAAPPGYQKQMLHWITTAKRPETRAARLAKLMAACAAGERLA